tara:strand:+ start:1058 stop:1813 length:756 start_codon:yes stop_codon:yes gene_type:complete
MALSLEEREKLKKYIKEQAAKMKENTTASVGSYDTPNAFTGDEDDDGTQSVDLTDPEYAYSIKGPKKRNPKYSVKLNEVSYQAFKRDESRSTVQKVNANILEVNKNIRELARMLQHSIKLKTEQKMDNNIHWKKTNEALAKMHKRISVLSEKANQLYNLTEATAQQAEKDLLALLNSMGSTAFKQLGPNDIDHNPVGADHFEFDVMLNGEPVAIDWDKGNLTYQDYSEEIPLGNIDNPEEVIANIQKHMMS